MCRQTLEEREAAVTRTRPREGLRTKRVRARIGFVGTECAKYFSVFVWEKQRSVAACEVDEYRGMSH